MAALLAKALAVTSYGRTPVSCASFLVAMLVAVSIGQGFDASPTQRETLLAMAGGGMMWADYSEEQQLVEQAQKTLEAVSVNPGLSAAFREMKPEVKAVFIAPRVQSDNVTTGDVSGSGVLLVRDDKTADWVGPAFYTIAWTDPSLQTSGAASDMILLVTTKQGLDAFTRSLFTLDKDVSIVPGTEEKGRRAEDIVGYARLQGRFTGFAPHQAVVVVSDIANAFYYNNKGVKPSDIIVTHDMMSSRSARLRKTAATVLSEGKGAR